MILSDYRVAPWRMIGDGAWVRESRPELHRPLDCPDYNRVYRPFNHQHDGACRNFDFTRMYCVYCAACQMSGAWLGIPYDVREKCDITMGW